MILCFRQDTADRSISSNVKSDITKKLLVGSSTEACSSFHFSPEFEEVFVNYYGLFAGGEGQEGEEGRDTTGNGGLVCEFP